MDLRLRTPMTVFYVRSEGNNLESFAKEENKLINVYLEISSSKCGWTAIESRSSFPKPRPHTALAPVARGADAALQSCAISV